MKIGRAIGYVFAVIFLALGSIGLLALGAETQEFRTMDIALPIVLLGLGIGLLTWMARLKTRIEQTIVQKVELSGDTELEEIKCKSCGAGVPAENIKLAGDGSVVVACPYCGNTYQLTEAPKW